MEQLNAHEVPLDPMLVEASAGTGKTWTITALYLRLLVERALSARSILVVTFTVAATGELRDRIRRRVREALRAASGAPTKDAFADEYIKKRGQQKKDAELLQRALSELDEAPIATLHAFCQRVLMERAFELGGPLELKVAADTGMTPGERWAHERWLRAIGTSPLLHAKLANIGAAKLAKIAAFADRWPDLEVRCAIDDGLQAALDAHARAERALGIAHGIVRDALSVKPSVVTTYVNGLPLKQCKLRDAGEEVTAFLSRSAEELALEKLPDCVRLLCRNELEGKLLVAARKKNGFPEHRIRDAIEQLVVAHDRLHSTADRVPRALLLDTARNAPRAISDVERSEEYVGFDDLLRMLRDALTGEGGEAIAARLRESYRAALVDEFQDTDPVQYQIVQRVFGATGVPLFLVGDPKQAIYGFRGADIHSYIEAARTAPDRRSLQTSQRADPPLVKALNKLFERAKDPFGNTAIAYLPVAAKKNAAARLTIDGAVPPALRVVALTERARVYNAGEAQEAMRSETIRDVVRLVGGGALIEGKPVRPGDIAVLMRSNDDADAMHAALRDAGIPAVLATEKSVLDTDEAKELAQVLAALVQPSNARRVRTALTTKLLGWSANDLERLEPTAEGDPDDPMRWENVVARLNAAQGLWRERGLYPAFRMLIDGERVAPRLLARERGDRRLANLLHLGEILHDVGRRHGLGPEALLAWFDRARTNEDARGEVAADALQIRLENDADAVRVSTIHKTKGLEFPIVILPSLWRSTTFVEKDPLIKVPPATAGRPHLRLRVDKNDPAEQADATAALEEERREQMRLAYVALTRARHQVHVYLPNCDPFDNSALAKLLGVFGQLPKVPRGGADRADIAEPRHTIIRKAVEDLARADRANIAVEIRPINPTPVPRLARTSAITEATIVPGIAPKLEYDPFRIASFSLLAAGAQHLPPATTVGEERNEARDVDDEDAGQLTLDEGPRVPLADFPRGRTAGDLVHAVLENLDFTTATTDAIREVALAQMTRGRFDAAHADTLAAALTGVLDTALLTGADLKLRDIAREKRIAELEFLLPVAERVGPVMLATTLEKHGDALHRRYASHARALGFDAWTGFLHGFVDLVFEHDGRFYVVDYKSNHLGDRASAYAPEVLAEAMLEKNYVLQYLLYCVALHRHLRDRLPGYDYEEHFGGALYLFVRGMSPASGARAGVFHDRPSKALIEALSELLGGMA